MQGREFEKFFKTKCLLERLKVLKLSEFGSKKAYKNGKLINIFERSPFDFIIQTEFASAFVDVKTRSYKHDYITPSFIKHEESTKHQYKVLKNELNGIRGFVVYFFNQDVVKFFHVDKINLEGKTYGEKLGSLETFSPRGIFGC